MTCKICDSYYYYIKCPHSIEEQKAYEKEVATKKQHRKHQYSLGDGYGTSEGGPAPLD